MTIGVVTVRASTFSDVPALVEMVEAIYPKSVFKGVSEVDSDYLRKLLVNGVQRHGGQHQGATCLFVAEHCGAVVGFMFGALDRTYGIGTTLTAQDILFVMSDAAPPRAAGRLIDAMTAWAMACPKVLDVVLTHTAIFGGDDRVGMMFKRKGFDDWGAAYRRVVGGVREEQAA
jgi:hypothetical protein